MSWILIVILTMPVNDQDFLAYKVGEFSRMDICFEARDQLVRKFGKPVPRHYQAVCVTKESE